jgi:hypothetical protein
LRAASPARAGTPSAASSAALPTIGGARYGIPAGTPVSFVILATVKRVPKPPRPRGIQHTQVTSGRINLAKVTGKTRNRQPANGQVLADQAIAALDALLQN